MKILTSNSTRRSGFALILVLILAGVCLLLLTASMMRTSTVATLNQRSNEYNTCANAAESAVEKDFARIANDFQAYNVAQVTINAGRYIYATNIPNAAEDPYWSKFIFSDGQGNVGRTYAAYVTNYSGGLPSAYTGLFTYNAPVYRIISNVQLTNSQYQVVGTAQEDVLLALVPLSTWAIFYNGKLEFTGCATMVVNGRVHANGAIEVGTSSPNTLTFNGGVTTTSTMSSPQEGGTWGPYTTGTWNTTFNANPAYLTNVASVNVSLAMTNSHFLIDIPPSGQDPTSSTNSQMLYNQAQMVLIVTNSPYGTNPAVYLTLQASSGGQVPGNDSSPLSMYYTNASAGFLATNLPFLSLTNMTLDQREQDTNLFTQIDVGKLDTWTSTNTAVQGKLPAASGIYPTIMYVADRRNHNANQLPAVRLVNGAQLPANGGLGFSVATMNPLYVWGNYNVQTATSGANAAAATTNTAATVPAALLSDAFTVLSPNWTDSQGYVTYSSSQPSAAVTTVNAAIVTGTMPTTADTTSGFSGGVHNLSRLLENWTGVNLWLNTSILRLWDSNMATNQYRVSAGNGGPNPYYNAPNRHFSFDPNFLDPAKVPPGIPVALVPIRFAWGVPPPGVITFTPAHN